MILVTTLKVTLFFDHVIICSLMTNDYVSNCTSPMDTKLDRVVVAHDKGHLSWATTQKTTSPLEKSSFHSYILFYPNNVPFILHRATISYTC